ncbi:MAG TPA: polymer-forming cytoskeletal protein [candidate division Zixibacteria bacterium]|nr:polymer-forming cytoskeletal protein [candidate division Zixibacteria bacterium]
MIKIDSSAFSSRFLPLIIGTIILIIFCASPSYALIATSAQGVDTLPDKIFDDLVIRDKNAVGLKLNEIGGDLIISAENINVTVNQVGGNLNAVGADIFIGGRIRESARMLGYSIKTTANISRNLTIAAIPRRDVFGLGSNVVVQRDCRVGKDVDIDAAVVHVRGTVGGDLRINAETVIIGGVIEGDATIVANSQLRLEPSCRIEGILTYSSPKEAEIEEGAQVLSGIIDHEKISYRGLFDIPLSWRIVFGFAALLVGVVFVLMFRRQILNLVEILGSRIGQSFGIGLLGAAAMLVYTAIFLITFMFALFYKPVFALVPLLAVMFIIFMLMFYLANILVAIFLGRLIMVRLTGNKECSPGRSLILGLIILTPLYGIPKIGIYLYVLSAMLGFGALMIGIYRQLRSSALA